MTRRFLLQLLCAAPLAGLATWVATTPEPRYTVGIDPGSSGDDHYAVIWCRIDVNGITRYIPSHI